MELKSSTRPGMREDDRPFETPGPGEEREASDRLAVLIPGLGAVATTWISGVLAVRRGLAVPVGSLTQLGTLDAPGFLGLEGLVEEPRIKEALPIAPLSDLVFGAWDLFEEDAYESAIKAQVLDQGLLDELASELRAIRPMSAVHDPAFLPRLQGPNVKPGTFTRREQVEALREDIRLFLARNGCSRGVMVWCASTERYLPGSDFHASLESFEKALDENRAEIAPSQLYAYAALMEGIPYANGSPNVSLELPCFYELALKQRLPIAGSDFKTGQTLLKTAIAPALQSRQLGVRGWFSTNILGNRDGEVLDDPGAFRSKEVSKSGVLADIFSAERQPELYGELSHLVRIHYYPPRGDNKEGWDNIDLFGWLGYPMQLKINFLCRDSILAAPVALDLALFLDLAARMGRSGPQSWLSFYFKAPLSNGARSVVHDLSVQYRNLQAELLQLAEEARPCVEAELQVSA